MKVTATAALRARQRRKRGSVTLEFTLAGLATIMLLISVFALAMGMWNYHTLAYMVHQGTRFVASKGVGCTKAGNTCSVTVGTITTQIATLGIGIPADQVTLTLTTDSGVNTICAPLNTCFTNSAVWPPATNTDNAVGKWITISAKYQYFSALLFFWPGQTGMNFGQVWLPASSTQTILF